MTQITKIKPQNSCTKEFFVATKEGKQNKIKIKRGVGMKIVREHNAVIT